MKVEYPQQMGEMVGLGTCPSVPSQKILTKVVDYENAFMIIFD